MNDKELEIEVSKLLYYYLNMNSANMTYEEYIQKEVHIDYSKVSEAIVELVGNNIE